MVINVFRHIRNNIRLFLASMVLGVLLGFAILYASHAGLEYSSTDDFCGLCHVHPQATYSWKKSTHYKNKSGTIVHCIDCHLPPGGLYYLTEKARLGIRDSYGAVFKDKDTINWDAKSVLEHAATYTYDASCMKCHQDLYSLGLTPKGVKAHEYYMKQPEKVRCINCHITVGHFQEKPAEEITIGEEIPKIERPKRPVDADEFVSYTQTIPETDVTFDMIAIPGGAFMMGSPDSEPYRDPDEGPQREVKISPFWMGEIEVSWREFNVFYTRTATHDKNQEGIPGYETTARDTEDSVRVDAITGPTPPYGSPDQGWGKGMRPAITMTHHAAMVYCEWLSKVTGKKFRLPTEAEWEYACRAGTTGPYYFEGDPKKLTRNSWINRMFRKDTSAIDRYVWSKTDSGYKTYPPFTKEANPWGLYNMLGNVMEFCLDWYAPDALGTYPGSGLVVDPTGPQTGTEHVVRGESYNSDPADLRIANRDHTQHDRWLVTDPQSPKSIWWYSDTKEVGFRVVRVFEEEQTGAK